MKTYIIGALDENMQVFDTTSVDAENLDEAVDLALMVFRESGNTVTHVSLEAIEPYDGYRSYTATEVQEAAEAILFAHGQDNTDRIIRALLDKFGYVYKLWTKVDLESALDDREIDLGLDMREYVIHQASLSKFFQMLQDADERDWDLISNAIDDGLEARLLLKK